MKLKNYVSLGATALSLGIVAIISQPATAEAITWHSSAVPSKLRGTWHAKQNYSYTFKITAHTLKYSGESRDIHLRWSYRGNGFYRLKSKHDSESVLVHYFNHHKLSSNSFWHDYTK